MTATESQQFDCLVVVGASAGGVEALSTLVATLPPEFPAPIVVAQHLDPRHISHLPEILARRSVLPVRTVTDEEHLAPGVVYVVPSDRHVEITDHAVRLRDGLERRPKPSVDRLLTTAASIFGERLIAVVLTGTGSDGASGAHAVKAAGGMVIIQNPNTAAYPGMPASLAPTTVDLVADVERIGPLLFDLLTQPRELTHPEATATLQTLLDQVRQHSGVDFGQYKQATILRRLQRRMAATGSGQLSDYRRYLATHPEEYQRLVASFLINVTEFFRDPELFAALREQVLPDLIAHAREEGDELRIWSAGCATGEEAYSLAILVAEALRVDEAFEQPPVQIFATDLDAEAVTFARRGIYPAASLAGLDGELRDRYFTRIDGSYEVSKRLRGMVVFGQHDLGQRAPFPRIDLVLCRNVLIYFTPELQQRALRLFAFALRDGGYLALGKAEGISRLTGFFTPVHDHLKLFRRHGERVLGPIMRVGRDRSLRVLAGERLVAPARPPASSARPAQPSPRVPAPRHARLLSERLGDIVFDAAVGVVVVDAQYDIQIINVRALHLLGIFTDAAGKDLVHLTRSIPPAPLRAAIDAAFTQPVPVPGAEADADASAAIVAVETTQGERRELQIACYPYGNSATTSGRLTPSATPTTRATAVLVIVSDATESIREQQAAALAAARAQVDQERKPTARHRSVRAQSDSDRAYDELKEQHERTLKELAQVIETNRTLLFANQEYAATTLDLRAVNEELVIGHEEAEATAEEVKTLNEELQSTNEELVTLNEENEATVEELHTANDDIQARNVELRQMATSLDQQHQASEAARARLEAILRSMGDAVLVVDSSGAPLLTNDAYIRMFGETGAGTGATFVAQDEEGRPLPLAATPQQRTAHGEVFIIEFTLSGEDGARRYFEANGQPIRSENTALGGVVAIRDITERTLQRRLQDEFISLASHELRTPLTPLTSYLQILNKQFVSRPEDARARSLIDRSLLQVKRLTRLVQDLVDVRRLYTGKFNMDMRPVRLDELVARAVEIAQTMAPASQEIHLEQPPPPILVTGDTERLEQALLNLLANAITYAPHTDRIDVRLAFTDNEAEVRVRDYGPGIPAAELSHLTERFYQVTRTDSDRPSRRGLGLGLYIVTEIVAAHGGRLEVASVEGQGATFTIQLPLANSPAAEHASARQVPDERLPTE
ncbi:MAG: CheR family methyltransferase [Ktedonobacterales bacterium]